MSLCPRAARRLTQSLCRRISIKNTAELGPKVQRLSFHSTTSMGDAQGGKSGDLRPLYNQLIDLFDKKDLLSGVPASSKVVDFQHPEKLKELLKLDINNEGCSDEEILKTFQRVIGYSVQTTHPKFFNQLYSTGDPYAVMASWATDLLNTNEHTFEVAPVFVLATQYVISRMSKLLGYEEGDGTFFPGGSLANMTAIHLARHRIQSDFKQKGLFGMPRMAMFTSEECHYSIKKGAMFLGFGLDSVRTVKTNMRGQMEVDDLEKQIAAAKEAGEIPFFVNATSGTTVLGAFDPLDKIADVCDKYKLWLHVDGCWGGAAIFSKKYRYLVKGIERTNSFAISLHKFIGAPIQCVPFIVNKQGALLDANSLNATYLFQPDKFYDTSYDIGDKTVQCGRRADGLKFWMMWKARGDKGLEDHINRGMELGQKFTALIRERPGFELVLPEFEFNNISFYYIPPSLRDQERTPEWWEKLDKVSPMIKERMTMEGSMLIGFNPQRFKGRVNFFRIIVGQNRYTKEEDLKEAVEMIERYGKDL